MTDLEFQDMVRADAKLTEWRNSVDLPRVRKIIHEHRQEIGQDGERMRIESLAEQIDDLQDDLDFRWLRWKWAKESGKNDATLALIAVRIPETEQEIERKKREFLYLLEQRIPRDKPSDKITPDMIERAKEHPIENFIDAQRGMALCIFHEDHHPSMSIKNNFAHCFSCGKTADVIDVYRKLHGATFPEAVKALQ